MRCFADFLTNRVIPDPNVKHLLISTSVPLVYLREMIESIGSRIISTLRDDIRDPFSTPHNKPTMDWLFGELRRIQEARSDITIVNLAGDIHVANAFKVVPVGFHQPIFQVTSSALTNRAHIPIQIRSFISVGKETTYSDSRGKATRLWPNIGKPNVLEIEGDLDRLVLTLKVFKQNDRQLVLKGGEVISLSDS